ncbi:DNA-directed RNA polymerase III subunit RPC4, partial [Stegodyphus mimosarum]
MDFHFSNCSSAIDSIRKMGASRRGGVRIRGGRLPPTGIRNDVLPSGTKKVVAPKIPQRRIQVKKEIPECSVKADVIAQEKRVESCRSRGQGSKIIVQTAGLFLGEGLAPKIKKELPDYHERAYLAKCSRNTVTEEKTEFQMKEDAYVIDDLLCHEDNQAFIDDENFQQPVKLPKFKQELRNIKQEPPDLDNKPFTKEEYNKSKVESVASRFFMNFRRVDNEKEKKDCPDDIKCPGEDFLMLIQLPTCLPFKKEEEELADNKTEDESTKMVNSKPDWDAVCEGHIGKLQILKSGRMLLSLGSVKFTLENASPADSLWEVASVHIRNKNCGDVSVLGKIEEKFTVRPLL